MNFLGMGPMELMLILVLALIVFGPGKLPEIAGQVGKAVRDLRRATTDLSSEFNRTLSLELEEKKEAEQAVAAPQPAPPPAPAAVQPVETAPITAASVAPATETTAVASTADTTPVVSTAEQAPVTVETSPAPSAEGPITTVAAPTAAADSTSMATSADTASSAEAETSSSSWEQRWNPPPATAEPGSEPAPAAAVEPTPVVASAEEGGEAAPKKPTRTRTRAPRKSTPAGPVADTPVVEDIVVAEADAETAVEEAGAPSTPAKSRKPRAPRRKPDATVTATVKEVADPARSS